VVAHLISFCLNSANDHASKTWEERVKIDVHGECRDCQKASRVANRKSFPANGQTAKDDGAVRRAPFAVLAFFVVVPVLAFAQHAPPARPFQRFDGCIYKPQRWNDGDSFHVILPDRYAFS
jgi:hypothetical protein